MITPVRIILGLGSALAIWVGSWMLWTVWSKGHGRPEQVAITFLVLCSLWGWISLWGWTASLRKVDLAGRSAWGLILGPCPPASEAVAAWRWGRRLLAACIGVIACIALLGFTIWLRGH
jgi:hypothetical protein